MASNPKAFVSFMVKGETDEVVYKEFFEEFKAELQECCVRWHIVLDSYDFHVVSYRKCMY